MPRPPSSKERTWALVLWLFLGACIWTGCGNDDPLYEIQLPNDYRLREWSWGDVIISNANGESIGESYFTVNQLSVIGDLVYGNYLYSDDTDIAVQEHFIVNTLSGEYQWFNAEPKWRAALTQAGIEHVDLQWPTDLRTSSDALSRFLLVVAILVSTSFVLIFFAMRSLARHELKARQQKWERL